MTEALDRMVARLAQAGKYRGLCPDVLRWAAERALAQHRSEKAALKAAKRSLHQAFGSFVDAPRRRAVLDALTDASTRQGSPWWAANRPGRETTF